MVINVLSNPWNGRRVRGGRGPIGNKTKDISRLVEERGRHL